MLAEERATQEQAAEDVANKAAHTEEMPEPTQSTQSATKVTEAAEVTQEEPKAFRKAVRATARPQHPREYHLIGSRSVTDALAYPVCAVALWERSHRRAGIVSERSCSLRNAFQADKYFP